MTCWKTPNDSLDISTATATSTCRPRSSCQDDRPGRPRHPARKHQCVVARAADPSRPRTKTSENRLQLDLITSDFDAETARLLALGAIKVKEICQNGARWLTLLDIEGNEFDLIAG